ncbi:Protein-lysine N-methyltransferase mettl10 [Smittium culicis]|uniref:Protein-lysine N-methyltransferase EFM4 n=1 Tax=Smittium culicis TaxID=133412 RepID=A0A1R1Y6D6_9FUNG|nr:Protein-lysine N-methyltransferase mettl10 [Smittium culicis]
MIRSENKFKICSNRFGEDITEKIVDWIEDQDEDYTSKTIVDIGCGNGQLLFRLQESGFTNLTGTDYSSYSIELAKQIQSTVEEGNEINFIQSDILLETAASDIFASLKKLNESRSIENSINSFDLVLDKGTFDAICLAPEQPTAISPTAAEVAETNSDKTETEKHKRVDMEARKKYLRSVRELMDAKKSVFLITSCNWTEDELVSMFSSYGFDFYGRIKHRSFTFGGVKGSTVSSVAFKLKKMPLISPSI